MGGPDFRGQPDIQTDAHVVIGTPTTALVRLHVVPTGNNPPAAVFEGSGDGSGYQARIELVDKQGGRRTWMVVAGAWSGGNFGIYDDFAAKYRLFIDTSGNVGIGVDTPGEKLEVNGKIKGAAVVISQAPGADASLQRDVADSYLAISGGKTRRGPTSGGLIQLMGNARAQNPGSIQYILGEGAASPKHIFYDNGPDATVQEIASIDNGGNASFNGNVSAANNVRARETGWFAISALQEVLKDNLLGVIPKGITVFCASPTDQSEVTVAGPSVAHWHDWAQAGEYPVISNQTQKVVIPKGSDYGAFVRVTATQIRVRAGDYVGWHTGLWQTSGYYKIVYWA